MEQNDASLLELAEKDPLVQEMHAFVALHSGFGACEAETFGGLKKLRAVNGAVISREISR
jgi:hypothetical protein